MTLSMTSSAPRSAVRHVEMGHRVIAVAGQIVGELGRNALLARQADDRAAAQRAAFQRARQRKSPRRPVPEKRHDADRPEQENVAARKIVAHPPAENARSQDQESPAPGGQHAASLVVPHHQPGGAIELLHPHRGDEQNGDKDGRCNGVRKFALERIGNLVIDRLGERRAPEDQRQVDAKRGRRDRPIGDRQAPAASARNERAGCSPRRARSPIQARFDSQSSFAGSHLVEERGRRSVFARPRSLVDKFGDNGKFHCSAVVKSVVTQTRTPRRPRRRRN